MEQMIQSPLKASEHKMLTALIHCVEHSVAGQNENVITSYISFSII